MISEIKGSGLRCSCWSVAGCNSNTVRIVSLAMGTEIDEGYLHNDKDSSEDRDKSRPCEPSNLLKLPETG